MDLLRHKPPFRVNGDDPLFFTRIDNGLGGDQQHLLALGVQLQVRIHARLKPFVFVGNLQANLQRTGGRIDAWQNVPFFNMKRRVRVRRDRNVKLRGVFQQIRDGFRYGRADPHRIHPLNLCHNLIFRNIHPGTQVKAGDHPVNGGFDGKPGLDRAGRS